MKTIVLKILLITNFLFLSNCRAQTTSDYVAFYNGLVPKLNNIAANKTQFYDQNFSNFYNELRNKNIDIIFILYDSKIIPGNKYHILKLYFTEINMWNVSIDNSFQLPFVSITFQDEIPPHIDQLSAQSKGRWNSTIAQFFANMKIESIRFVGVNGYNNPDRTIK